MAEFTTHHGGSSTMQPISFEGFNWHQCRLSLQNQHWQSRAKASPLIILRALLYEVGLPGEPIFHLYRQRLVHLPIGASERFQVDLRFFGRLDSEVDAWCERFAAQITHRGEKNFALLSMAKPARHFAQELHRDIPEGDEACLIFRTPFAYAAGKRSTRMPFDAFTEQLRTRFQRLLGAEPALPTTPLRALDHYWRLETRLRHQSKSEQGQQYSLNGCLGAYYLRGDIAAWWPWLRLAEVAHLGKRLPFGLGAFDLQAPGPAQFHDALTDVGRLRAALDHVLHSDDQAAQQLASQAPSPFAEDPYCEELAKQIRNGGFQPAPNLAFDIPKEHGGTRRIEQPAIDSMVIARHLHNLLAPSIDRLLEPASYGFRAGRSREDAAEAIERAIGEGYRHVVETDIADFFPSIDHGRLRNCIEEVVPHADQILLQLIDSMVRTPFRLQDVVHPRERGLAQGLALSPLLANLYLDSLDEWLATFDARAVRYADDLLILTQSPSDSEKLLAALNREVLSLKLSLAAAKTKVGSAEAGFSFLGFRFPRETGDDAPAMSMRKPLHVTEPFTFLGVRGDALEVRAHGAVRDLIPLRRLDRILLHAPATVSTTLLRRLQDRPEPISLGFASGSGGARADSGSVQPRGIRNRPPAGDSLCCDERQRARCHRQGLCSSENGQCHGLLANALSAWPE